MNTTPVAEIGVGDLGVIGQELGSGGQAVVHDMPDLELPGEPAALVYKRYKPGMGTSRSGLAQLIGARHRLPVALRDRLDSVTAWPLAAVVDGTDAVGVVLPRIPDGFFQDVVLPSGTSKTIVREVQHLFVPQPVNDRIGMPTPDEQQRLRICRDLADTLAFLHSADLEISFGDLNAMNELFRLDAEPMMMLVDCDAARPRGSMAAQPNTPDWVPPDPQERLSRLSDCYKLALFILRCLTPGPQASTRTDPDAAAGVLDATGIDMLRKAIHGLPTERPTAVQWFDHLSRALGEPVDPPELHDVLPDSKLVVAGQPLTVRWTAQNAQFIEFLAADADPVIVDGRAGSGVATLFPVRTGRIQVIARNRLGESTAASPPVMVANTPGWVDLPVPVPAWSTPDREALALPGLTAVLPSLPAVGAVGRPPALRNVEVWQAPDPSRTGPASVNGPPPIFDVEATGLALDELALFTAAPDDPAQSA